MPRFFDCLPVRSRLRCLPDEILFDMWHPHICQMLMCQRFLLGLAARRRAAIVIQRAWDMCLYGPEPGLLHYDPHDMPYVVPYNPWMHMWPDFDDLEEVD